MMDMYLALAICVGMESKYFPQRCPSYLGWAIDLPDVVLRLLSGHSLPANFMQDILVEREGYTCF